MRYAPGNKKVAGIIDLSDIVPGLHFTILILFFRLSPYNMVFVNYEDSFRIVFIP
jgi:hypothetical protein